MSSSSSLILTSSGKRDISTVLSAIIWFSNHALVFICHFPHLWITVAIFSLTSRLRSRHTYRTLALRYFAPSQRTRSSKVIHLQDTKRENVRFPFPLSSGKRWIQWYRVPRITGKHKKWQKVGKQYGIWIPMVTW